MTDLPLGSYHGAGERHRRPAPSAPVAAPVPAADGLDHPTLRRGSADSEDDGPVERMQELIDVRADGIPALPDRGGAWAVEWFTSPRDYAPVLPLPAAPVPLRAASR